ncbi:XRE family transcriptional regulator [Pantoea ananatis]|uniref:XRE family transcriptional regulator n=1 Tax=Pantoea ananas TaxID=553 RepID=UPI002350CB2D|nr:XRE family transcriptional regulator [Pantoea ananatis]MDC7862240.1 hypothetical protein [Pantoea ananatis]
MSFRDRLKQAMLEQGLTQAALAEKSNMAQSMIWKLTTGNAKGTSKIINLAKALNVRPEWLGEGSGPMRESEESNQELEQNHEPPFYAVEIFDGDVSTNSWLGVPELLKSKSLRAYDIKENTGCSEVPAGTYIVIDGAETPSNNDLIYAKIGTKASVYRFLSGGAEDFLSVDDPRIPLIPVSSAEIIGVIVFLLRGLKRHSNTGKTK